MRNKDALVDKLLASESRDTFLSLSGNIPETLPLPAARKLVRHVRSLGSTDQCLKLGIVHSYTSDLLDPWFEFEAAMEGLDIDTYHAPYGLNILEAQAGSGLIKHQPDLTVFMLKREDLHPALRSPISGFSTIARDAIREEIVDRLRRTIEPFRQNVSGQIIVTILPRIQGPGLGLYDSQSERSEQSWWSQTKNSIATCVRESFSATLFLDMDVMLADLGRTNFFDLRFWYSSAYPFTTASARTFARRIVHLGTVAYRPKAKLIVLDADNTMWGGVIGEDGMQGIALSPEYPGSAFIDFQRRILEFQQRGFVLAICSKNNEEDLYEVLDDHPHQILRKEHFVAVRANWEPKHENLISIAQELNLGLESFIFVDDSEHECDLVRRKLPEVTVVQTPANALDIPACLEGISRLEVVSLTKEDLEKTKLYAQERQRQDHMSSMQNQRGGVEDYLQSLQMKMRIGRNNSGPIARLVQLTKKTNQFNVTTRRYTDQEMRNMLDHRDWIVAHFSLADTFGDSGIVGLTLIEKTSPKVARIDSFLMSCRVIGRRAESAFLEAVLRDLAADGITTITAEYIATKKNRLVDNFFLEHDFTQTFEGLYERCLSDRPPKSEKEFPIEVSFD